MVNVVAENGGDATCVTNSCQTENGATSYTLSNNNLLGFAFFSYGNVSSAVGHAHYVTVNGIDPIGFGGTLPTCPTASLPCLPNFSAINNGDYPYWNIVRMTTTGENGLVQSGTFPNYVCGPSAGACLMEVAVQNELNVIEDLTPLGDMNVFRSHYAASAAPHNGNISTLPEAGGDVGGAIFSIQADIDNHTNYGVEILTQKQ
jgi:hypothetical protein